MRDILPAMVQIDDLPEHVQPALPLLQAFADRLAQRYGAAVYLVGEALTGDGPPPTWALVCVLPDQDFERSYGPVREWSAPAPLTDTRRRWALDCAAQSHLGSSVGRGVYTVFEALPLSAAQTVAAQPRLRLDAAPRRLDPGGMTAEPVHDYYSLSYATHAVQPRVLAQSMPVEWQHRYVQCLRELDQAFGHVEQAGYRISTGTWHAPETLGDGQLAALGWAWNGDRTEIYDPEGEHHHPFQQVVFLPAPDPLPGYDRGRTRVPLDSAAPARP